MCVFVEVTYHRTGLVQTWRTLFSFLTLQTSLPYCSPVTLTDKEDGSETHTVIH